MASVSQTRLSESGDTAMFAVTPAGSPQDAATERLVEDLREEVLPGSLSGEAHVGGTSALTLNQSDHLAERLPLFVTGVVGLSFLLLVAAFRAPLIAAKAGVVNLLSVGAAFGMIALFAQGGFFGELIGIARAQPRG